MPVYKLKDEMPYDELLGWYDYFERRPYGWRDDDRASKIIQAQGVKEKPWKLFPSLDRIYNPGKGSGNPADTLVQSAFFQKMMNAVGGDKISL